MSACPAQRRPPRLCDRFIQYETPAMSASNYTSWQYLPLHSQQALTDGQKYTDCSMAGPVCTAPDGKPLPPPRALFPSLAMVTTPSQPSASSCVGCSGNGDDRDSEAENGEYNMDDTLKLKESFFHSTHPPATGSASLLPLLDYQFNAREICKQCILLEDHLTHPEKRCADCCVKHFLGLEGLSEEALTLDQNSHLQSDERYRVLYQLPNRIRQLQAQYYKDPHSSTNARHIAQQLRQIRKQLQGVSFGFIFRQDAGSYRPVDSSDSPMMLKQGNCSGGTCALP